MNRLNLNWKLNLKSERVEFAKTYLDSISFVLTEEELEVISNYILWGKNTLNEKDGPARLKADGVFLESNWSTPQVESLDELIESPTFNELELSGPSTKKTREVFSRNEARRLASPEVLESLEALWQQIDLTDLIINFYDLEHGRRKNPIRSKLLESFSEKELEAAKKRAMALSQFSYFRLKHQLVELRQQQYNYQDSYRHTILPQRLHRFQEVGGASQFGADIEVLPLGLKLEDKAFFAKIFNSSRMPEPNDFTDEELNLLGSFLWRGRSSKKVFDFSDTKHLYRLFEMWDELNDKKEESSSLSQFMETARTYIGLAQLDEKEQLILDMKIEGRENQEIRDTINLRFNHKYQLNYISTLYCKKVLGKIAEASRRHREVCENLCFPENFKKCKDCGRTLLLDEKDWMKRKRSNDGFSPRCKCCDKKKRLRI